MKASAKPRLGSRGRPEQSRSAILQAAIREFSREGVAGARTSAIARSARVNKALLYYYFKDKEALYSAVLDEAFGGLHACVQEALALPLPPRQRLLAYVKAHFDYVAGHSLYSRLVQGEMMRASRGSATQLEAIVKDYFRPLYTKLADLLKEGAEKGDFRKVDPIHFVPSMVAVIVFYFTNLPVTRLMRGGDPLAPDRIAERREAVLDFISSALFRHSQERR